VFISHGRREPIMDVDLARRARALLEAAALPVAYQMRRTKSTPLSSPQQSNGLHP
jgi:predicted esterase